MKTYNSNKHAFNTSFIDILFNILLVFAMLFIFAFILINKPTQDKKIDSKAEIMIVMTWPNDSADDVDLWVLTPELQKIGFSSRENTYAHLERDDLGLRNDYIERETGKPKLILVNKEVTTIRTTKSGKYVVNVHLFERHNNPLKGNTVDHKSIPVVVELIQLNPRVNTLFRVEVILNHRREEKTAFSFNVVNENTVMNIQRTQFPFIYESF